MLTSNADDSFILIAHRDHEGISKKLSKSLKGCSDWLIDNKCVLFAADRKVKANDDFIMHCFHH